MNSSSATPCFLDVIPQQWAAIVEAIERLAPHDRYLHWDELRQCPQPEGISHEAWWSALKMARASRLQPATLSDRRNIPFRFNVPNELIETLHQVDRGERDPATKRPTLDRFAARALLEESISSAQLAGAGISYEAAKELLRTGRPPRDKGERMVVNQQLALQKAGEWRDCALSPAMVQELHRCLTTGTLDDVDAAGRLRRNGEDSPVVDADGTIRHEPPPAGELPRRMELMCAFANGQAPEFFIHPVIRAMVLHFWLAHDRPFMDGNGRAARVLFLWAMRRQGYHVTEFISISSIVRRAPGRYAQAFLHTETDDNDLTYFLLHQAEVMRTAEREWREELVHAAHEVEAAEKKLRGFAELNTRQQAVVVHALHHPETRYRIAHHQHSHGVTHQTARDDLFDLARRELLTAGKEGRIYVFRAPADLLQRLQSEAKRRRGRKEAYSTDELPTALL